MATMSEREISAMKETLAAQQHLLQKLYNELDAERESSATAASEALSVILRLQGEKAAVKMEAEQYKRLAEERMCHAEESFAIIEGIIHEREMEVAALDYQVQSYRHKLQSMGEVDPITLGSSEFKYPENLLLRGQSLGTSPLGRRNSAPVLEKYKKALMEWESDLANKDDLECQLNDNERLDDSSHHGGGGGGINSYAEEIRRLDIQVKEIVGSPSGNCEAASVDPGVHDIFEVPQVDETKTEEDVGVMLGSKDDQLDRVKNIVNQISGIGEEKSSGSREDQVQLLKEIKSQLDLLQGQMMKSQEAEKSSEPSSSCPLPEAMMHFWL